ncbi:Glycosyltransferase involved in cell wall bisynthesis [Cryobacterium psychrotolerans]|uniref:Glycosyltransferase involved in cell wall bisynthesis n=1 Tax=Cryobacterium psychrotolerans TaxID=386301 RepID=A0A1G9CIP3_9MICO|nr:MULTISPECIES: hypothetical protein [Cryobacterium]TFD45094.1 hypothetical protein E3T33_07510 [Cryobacterium sp. TMT1-2-1]TFD84272.1 hypothetical protein E3T56_11305 [Cryobacterium psychrotolerans]SDK51466.1 Glycosyltransferase involved in cell wall bisynthesis [Cryobacterium psychrotolerans]
MKKDLTVTHLFDAADVGKLLAAKGREAGLDWRYRNVRDLSHDSNPVRKYAGALAWHAGRIIDLLPSDLIHLHYGRRTSYLQLWPRRPYVLHFHGTDIRHHFHQPYAHDVMLSASATAQAVLYSTPDLREHAIQARADAVYFPIPVDVPALPAWRPAETPTIVFASRWDGSKNADFQLDIARGLVARAGGAVRVQGLDWGDSAGAAREAGVEIMPRMPKPEYLRWLAGAHVVAGQAAGVVATSELEAIGIGVPVVMPLHPAYDTTTPVITAETSVELVTAALAALEQPQDASRALGGPAWMLGTHDASMLAARLADMYRGLPL